MRCRAVPRSRQRRGCRVSLRAVPSGLHVCGRSHRVFVVHGWTAQHTKRSGSFSLPPVPHRDDLPHHVGLRLVHSWSLRGDRGCNGLLIVSAGLHYALRRPVCMLVVPSWSVWRGGGVARPVVLASFPEKKARQLARRAPQETSPSPKVSQLVRHVRLVGMALRSLARSAHLESTQKIMANHAVCVVLSVPSLCLHIAQSAMPVLQDSTGATLPPPRALRATWVLSPILLALRRVSDAVSMMTLVPPSGPRLSNVSAEGSFSGSMPTGQAQSRVALAWKALDCLNAAPVFRAARVSFVRSSEDCNINQSTLQLQMISAPCGAVTGSIQDGAQAVRQVSAQGRETIPASLATSVSPTRGGPRTGRARLVSHPTCPSCWWRSSLQQSPCCASTAWSSTRIAQETMTTWCSWRRLAANS